MIPNKKGGFILQSTLINITISTCVLSVLLGIIYYAIMWDAKLLDTISMMEDGRFTRRMIVAHMVWGNAPIKVSDKELTIQDMKRTTFTIRNHALYRKLSDGSLQPASGSRILGTIDKRNVESKMAPPFYIHPNGTLYLHWQINNRFLQHYKYTEGYGDLAIYEVAIGQCSIYDWYTPQKKREGVHGD